LPRWSVPRSHHAIVTGTTVVRNSVAAHSLSGGRLYSGPCPHQTLDLTARMRSSRCFRPLIVKESRSAHRARIRPPRFSEETHGRREACVWRFRGKRPIYIGGSIESGDAGGRGRDAWADPGRASPNPSSQPLRGPALTWPRSTVPCPGPRRSAEQGLVPIPRTGWISGCFPGWTPLSPPTPAVPGSGSARPARGGRRPGPLLTWTGIPPLFGGKRPEARSMDLERVGSNRMPSHPVVGAWIWIDGRHRCPLAVRPGAS